MSILVEHNGVNINDYIVSCDQIPYFYMNLDGTMGLPDYSMEVSNVYPGTLTQGDVVNVTVNGKVIHNGFIYYAENIYESRTTRLTIYPFLACLQDKKIDTDSLDVTSTDPAQYSADNDSTYKDAFSLWFYEHVQVIWVIKKMFDAVGLILDTSTIAETDAGTYTDTTGTLYTYKAKHIYIDANALYLINQSYASTPETTRHDWESVNAKPTFFDFVVAVCGLFGWVIVLDSGYKLVAKGSRPPVSLSDDNRYSFMQGREQKEYDKARYVSKYAERHAYMADVDVKNPLNFPGEALDVFYPESSDYTLSVKKIPWMNNLWFIVHDMSSANISDVFPGGVYGAAPLSPADSIVIDMFRGLRLPFTNLTPAIIAATSDRIITETTTDFNTNSLEVYEHYFDLEKRRTILKEISFL